MSSTSSSYPEGYDSLNQNQSGVNILTFWATNGQTPFVPQPLGSSTAPISHLPPPPGLLPSPGQLTVGEKKDQVKKKLSRKLSISPENLTNI